MVLAFVFAVMLSIQIKGYMGVSAEVGDSDRVLSEITHAQKSLAEAESGMRGFILSRSEELLEPYHQVSREMGPAFDRIAAGASPRRRELIDQARLATEEWLTFTRWPIRLTAEGKDPRQVIPQGTGKRIRAKLVERLAALERYEREVRDTRLRESKTSARVTLGAVFGIVFLLGIGVAFRSRRIVLELSSDYEQVILDYGAQAAQLDESRQRFSTTLNSIGDGVIVVDPNERIEFLNPVAERLTGWSLGHARGKSMSEVFEILADETKIPTVNPARQVLREGRLAGVAKHTVLQSRNGTEIPIEDSAAPIYGNEGQVVGVVLVFRDTTEKTFAASIIAETEKRFQALANSAPVLIWTAGKDRFCDWFNENWLQFRGRALQEEIGSGWLEGIHPEDLDRVLRVYMNAFDGRKNFEMHYRFLRADGEYRDVLNRGSPRFSPSGRFLGYIGSCTDVTQSEAVRKKLEALTIDLERAVHARDEFLSIASHELKTPLTSLQLQLQMAERGIRSGQMPTAEKMASVVSRCLQQSTRITNLIDELLDISRIQEGKLSFNFESIDLGRLVEDQVSQYREQFRAAGCDVRFESTHVDVVCDRFRMEQVIVNLLTNAMKYGGRKPVRVEVGGDPREAWIRVSDQGGGIPKDRQAQIFNRFERGEQGASISGLGLGLYIARQIVTSHLGEIEVSSEPGQGASFTVKLPRHRPIAVTAPHQEVSPA